MATSLCSVSMDHHELEQELKILTVTLDELDHLLEESERPQPIDGWPLSVLVLPILIIYLFNQASNPKEPKLGRQLHHSGCQTASLTFSIQASEFPEES